MKLNRIVLSVATVLASLFSTSVGRDSTFAQSEIPEIRPQAAAQAVPGARKVRVFLPALARHSPLAVGLNLDPQNDAQLAAQARLRNDPRFTVNPKSLRRALTASEKHSIGEWEAPVTWPLVPVTAAYLPDGRIMAFAGDTPTTFGGGNNTVGAVWNPLNNTFVTANHDSHGMFSGIPVIDESGNVIVVGGDGTREAVSTFDWQRGTWSRLQNMSTGRSNPGVVSLANGQIVALVGSPGGLHPEVFTPGSGWSLRTGVDVRKSLVYVDIQLPNLWLTPNGHILIHRSFTGFSMINTDGNGSVTRVGSDASWLLYHSGNVMYDEGKVLMTGGWSATANTPSSVNNVMMVDIAGTSITRSETSPMVYPRSMHNTVVLPTGEVMVVGGNTGQAYSDVGSVLTPEVWNPNSRQWRTLAEMSIPRNYNSVALLMNDGRVWSASGGLCSCSSDQPTHQIFSPPYLFNPDGSPAQRPVIHTGPTRATHAERMAIKATPGIQKFTMVRMSALTRGQNSDLRFLPVSHTTDGVGNYTLTLHENANVLTPGYWMLFAVNSQGTPSMAHTLQVVNTLSLAEIPPMRSPAGRAMTYQPIFVQSLSALVTFAAQGLPPGLTINSRTGLISGTPERPGTYTVTLRVSDNIGSPARQQLLNWTVTDALPAQLFRYVRLTAQREVADYPWTTVAEVDFVDVDGNPIPYGGWSATADSEMRYSEAFRAIDRDTNSHWRSDLTVPMPHWLTIDLGAAYPVTGIVMLPHQRAPGGRIAQYVVHVSADGVNWGDSVAGSTWENDPLPKKATFTLPPPPFALKPVLLAPPVPVGVSMPFTATSTGGFDVRYKWSFGDGTPETAYSSSATVQKTFTQPGRYTVRISAIDVGGVERTTTFVQAVHLPHTNRMPTRSSSILSENRDGRDRVWVVNPDSDSVSVIDATNLTRLAEIAVAQGPRAIALAPNGDVWVTARDASALQVIDASSLSIKQTIALPYASQPYGLAFAPDGSAAYVADAAGGRILKFDPVTGALLAQRVLGQDVRDIAVSADGASVYVSRYITPRVPGEHTATVQVDAGAGEIFQVNGADLTLVSTIRLGHSAGLDTENRGRGIANYLGGLAISPDGVNGWLPSKKDNVARGTLRDGQALSFQNTVRAISSRVDLRTGVENLSARVDFDNSAVATGAQFDRSGNYLFVALESSREIAVVDAYVGTELARLTVGRAPHGLALSSDGMRLYVANFMDRGITVVDISGLMNRGDAAVTALATLDNLATERLSADVLRGKQFFYDAADTRLARDASLSCAACHAEGGHDGRVWDFTSLGEGLRNTIPLNGRGGAQGFLHWSGNFDEVHDFEGQIRSLAGGTGLMTDASYNSGTRAQPLGTPKAGQSADLDALAAYVSSLNRHAVSPARQSNGALTGDAQLGRDIFRAQCASCHGGPNYTLSGSVAVQNIGTIKTSSGSRSSSLLTGIDVPTLRDVWATAPYLHDGSAATIEEAIQAHDNLTLTAADLTRVAVFARQIGATEPETAASSNLPPEAAILTPVSGAAFVRPSTFNIVASASDPDGSVSRVALFAGSTLLREFTSPPYSFVWEDVPVGSHVLTVRVTDSSGISRLSAPVNVVVNLPANVAPIVTLVSPVASGEFVAPAAIALKASASDSDGSITRVEFLSGTVTLAETTDAPYEAAWPDVPAGQYTLTARVTDNAGATNMSNPVEILVKDPPNLPPIVRLVSPVANETYVSSTPIGLAADAYDLDGKVVRVEFYVNGTKLGEQSTAPFGYNWSGGVAGSHNIVLRAYDNRGASTDSAAVTINIQDPVPGTCAGSGGITRDVWNNQTPSWRLNNLPLDRPASSSATLPSFEALSYVGEMYATRMRGYICPPTMGSYVFWIAADDLAELYVGTSSSPTTRQRVAAVYGWAGPRDWDRFPEQRSVSLTLNAGQRYYVEVLHRQNYGGDNLAVAWQGPGIARQVIPGSALVSWDGAFPTNQPPQVSLMSPAANSVFAYSTLINLMISARDPDGSIHRVEIYSGTDRLVVDHTAPYQVSLHQLPVGNIRLSARAIDQDGASAVSVYRIYAGSGKSSAIGPS
jgi:large repetitive protein